MMLVDKGPSLATSQSGSPSGATNATSFISPKSFACCANCRNGVPSVTAIITAVAPLARARAMKGAQSVVSIGA
jgi:hypothetical protein